MPKVHFVKKARKSNKAAGIKKGDSYYWWKFRRGGKQVSLTRPRPSQLTQSEFLSTVLGLEERISAIDVDNADDMEALAADLSSAAEEIRSLADDCREKASNMESAFSGGSPTIDLLNERADACDRIADDLERAYGDAESIDDSEDDWPGSADEIRDSIDWSVE